ncbi:MAG: helix-turn-helix domain-containing protein [Psychrobacillus sp.]|uniref:helix-turn-helix domain-containing protein n=1 Tax=Solibacillus sp. FSL R7-0682 TaxID=2921690 RepID=UPI0030F89C43
MNEQDLNAYLENFKKELIEVIEQQLNKPEKQLLTFREAAEYVGVSYNTFQKFRYNGLKFFEVDGIKRIYKKELDEFIKNNSL